MTMGGSRSGTAGGIPAGTFSCDLRVRVPSARPGDAALPPERQCRVAGLYPWPFVRSAVLAKRVLQE
jgi:hypothetical protein